MGTFCGSDKREVKIIGSDKIIDAIEFYDVIVNIQSIKEIIRGWNIKFNKRVTNYDEFIKIKENEKVLKIGIIGNSNKGKSFILSKLSHIDLPFGTSIKTEGLSIKYPDLKEYKNRKIVLLDSAGLETPVTRKNNKNMNDKEKKDENIENIEKHIKKNGEYFMEESREKLLTELFLQNYIIHNSDILIVVVGILTYSEQKLLNRIKIDLKNANLNKTLFIIHNLMTYTTNEQVEDYIDNVLLKSATFELEKHEHIDVKTQIPNGVRFYEKYTTQPIFHLIFANEYSEAGKYYNNYTLSFLENSFEKIVGLGGFDVINTIKKRFKEISKDIIENLKDEIVFDDTNKNLIKLKKPQKITLKRCFIDELGFSNIRASGFTPNYSYYFNNINKQIIVDIEAPGNCDLVSTVSLDGEYIIIKITGNKNLNEKQAIIRGREFGQFSLDIPLKLRDLYIKQSGKELVFKNQEPKIEKKDGVFTIVYQLEESFLTGGLSPKY